MRRVGAALGAAAILAACRDADRAQPTPPNTAPNTAPNAAPAAADAYAPSVLIGPFRARVPEHPARLGGGEASADALLGRYVRAVAARDTATLGALALSVSEFAWLYYLDSPMAQKPYELDPETMWAQIAAQSGRGLTRALQRYGGATLGAAHSACGAPRAAGALRLLDCTVTFRPAGARDDASLRLAVVERDGRYKLVGFGTNL
jgi:hypothetical protein